MRVGTEEDSTSVPSVSAAMNVGWSGVEVGGVEGWWGGVECVLFSCLLSNPCLQSLGNTSATWTIQDGEQTSVKDQSSVMDLMSLWLQRTIAR